MELNRFKQLLESTMGDVKPLISEQEEDTVKNIVNSFNKEPSTTDNTKNEVLSWDEFKTLLKSGSLPFKGVGDTIEAGPETMFQESKCSYYFMTIKSDGTFNIHPYNQECFKSRKDNIKDYWNKRGYNLEDYTYQTWGYPKGQTTNPGYIDNLGLTTNIKFNSKFNDDRLGFEKFIRTL